MLPAGHGLAVVLDVGGHRACLDGGGRLEAEAFLQGGGDQPRVLRQLPALPGCSARSLPAQPMRRVVVSLPAPRAARCSPGSRLGSACAPSRSRR